MIGKFHKVNEFRLDHGSLLIEYAGAGSNSVATERTLF
jgi:hypothetical protein